MILRSLQAMQKQVAGMENPFLESGTYAVGRRIAFRHGGRSLDPVAGQFLMDFDPTGRLLPARDPRVHVIADAQTAADFFQRGVALEEDPHTHDEAIAMYGKVLELDPGFAAAHINIGTLLYNRNDYKASEYHYRKAIESDPKYALAYFDLGNVLDETGRMVEAASAYRTALVLAPTYADAHYNLALAYEKMREPRKALKHWKAYVKLDAYGPWTIHAKHQIRRILENERLKVVYRSSEPISD
jgi:tetratricopeptide (TPR) repeat protein